MSVPPWHYVGNCLAVEYRSRRQSSCIVSSTRSGVPLGGKCAVYFADWQYASESGEEYLDPIRSQYRETIFLISARYEGDPCAYCPFIWVNQDVALMRGLAQGWPKQIGSIWMTRSYDLPSKATPAIAAGGKFAATLAVKDRRLVEAIVTLQGQTTQLPTPSFARAVNVRHFPELAAGRHDLPAVHELVQLKSRDVHISPIWKGTASLQVLDHPYLELPPPARRHGACRVSFLLCNYGR